MVRVPGDPLSSGAFVVVPITRGPDGPPPSQAGDEPDDREAEKQARVELHRQFPGLQINYGGVHMARDGQSGEEHSWPVKRSPPEEEMAQPAPRHAKAFELLSGIFGWVWIAASVAGLVLAGLALFGRSSWWFVLYAVGVAAVAKWLARGFLDHKSRVYFEQELIANGMSPEDAQAAWLDAYQRR